ncbi:MAG: ribonuclease H family protein [Caldilineales bacterium]|nr:ribonuclease H family protein [Caldilineales bacterium]
MATKRKYYVVWKGRQPGIYETWDACLAQVSGFGGAKYKAFPTRAEAQTAFRGDYADYVGQNSGHRVKRAQTDEGKSASVGRPIADAYAVDAACSGNPGVMEYRCVHVGSDDEIFHRGPFPEGTNNIGEFLAIVQALALLQKQGRENPIYSDSRVAIKWVKDRHCRTTLKRTPKTDELYDLIARAEDWLTNNRYKNRLIKWETKVWGEIPADFGRKG